jgi:hypothetical protein
VTSTKTPAKTPAKKAAAKPKPSPKPRRPLSEMRVVYIGNGSW